MQLDFQRSDAHSAWVSTDQSIQKWLSDRQNLLVLLYKLSVVKPRSYTIPTAGIVQEFCDTLVDYVSAGHFEIFEKIFNASEQNNFPEPDKTTLHNILNSTNEALAFSDKYAESTEYADMPELLSALSECLADRFDLEDSLIQHYIKATDLN